MIGTVSRLGTDPTVRERYEFLGWERERERERWIKRDIHSYSNYVYLHDSRIHTARAKIPIYCSISI